MFLGKNKIALNPKGMLAGNSNNKKQTKMSLYFDKRKHPSVDITNKGVRADFLYEYARRRSEISVFKKARGDENEASQAFSTWLKTEPRSLYEHLFCTLASPQMGWCEPLIRPTFDDLMAWSNIANGSVSNIVEVHAKQLICSFYKQEMGHLPSVRESLRLFFERWGKPSGGFFSKNVERDYLKEFSNQCDLRLVELTDDKLSGKMLDVFGLAPSSMFDAYHRSKRLDNWLPKQPPEAFLSQFTRLELEVGLYLREEFNWHLLREYHDKHLSAVDDNELHFSLLRNAIIKSRNKEPWSCACRIVYARAKQQLAAWQGYCFASMLRVCNLLAERGIEGRDLRKAEELLSSMAQALWPNGLGKRPKLCCCCGYEVEYVVSKLWGCLKRKRV